MVTVYIIAGSTGAGKTTFAKKLEQDTGSVRFSLDEWLATLFWDDHPDPLTFEWAQERTRRSERQIMDVAVRILELGQNVILDFGFMTKGQRTRFIEWTRSLGAVPYLYYVETDEHVRQERVRSRNQEKGENFSIEITSPMFEFAEGLFDIPDPSECENFKKICN